MLAELDLQRPPAGGPLEAPDAQPAPLGAQQPGLDAAPQDGPLGLVAHPAARDHVQAGGAPDAAGVQLLGQAPQGVLRAHSVQIELVPGWLGHFSALFAAWAGLVRGVLTDTLLLARPGAPGRAGNHPTRTALRGPSYDNELDMKQLILGIAILGLAAACKNTDNTAVSDPSTAPAPEACEAGCESACCETSCESGEKAMVCPVTGKTLEN